MRLIGVIVCALWATLGAAQADERTCGYTDDFRLICDDEWRVYSAARSKSRAEAPALRGGDTRWANGLRGFVRGGYSFEASARNDGVEADIPQGPFVSAGISAGPFRGGPDAMRLEGEFVFARSSQDQCVVDPILGPLCVDTRFSLYGPFVNALWEGRAGPRLRPYVGFGVGAAFLESEATVSGISDEESEFAVGYQARLGVSAPIAKRWSVSGGYRYLGALNDQRYSYHVAEAGLAYEF